MGRGSLNGNNGIKTSPIIQYPSNVNDDLLFSMTSLWYQCCSNQ